MPFIDEYVHDHFYNDFPNKIQGIHYNASETGEKHKTVKKFVTY
jgi:hypothetical protein